MAQTETSIKYPKGKGTVFNQIASWFSNLFHRYPRQRTWFGTREVVADVNSEMAVTEGFSGNTAVYSIIQRDAKKFARIPTYVADAKSLQEKRAKFPLQFKALVNTSPINNALAKLINRPNPYQGRNAFRRTARAYFQACGETFVWLNRGDTEGKTDLQVDLMPVLEMYVLPSYRVEVVPDPENLWGILGYILKVGGESMPLRKNDVVHWKNTNLLWDASTREHLRGMPPLKPGAGSMQQNKDATLGSVRMIQNDGAKGALYTKTLGTPAQESQIRSVIDRKINNNDVKGAVATLQGEWDYVDLGKSSIDLQLLEAKSASMMELCFLFGVPYTQFDPNTAYANSEWQQKNWITNEIIPACEEFDDELNRALLRAFAVEGKMVIVSDYSELPEMQADLKAMTEWLKEAWWIKPDERRELQGYEAIGGFFDEPWVPTGYQPLSKATEDDGFDDMANDLGLSDYKVDPPKAGANGQQNGKLNGQAKTT